MDPSQLEVLRLSPQEASRIPPRLRPGGLSSSSGAVLDLPLDQGLYHWTLQWQRDEALREKVGCECSWGFVQQNNQTSCWGFICYAANAGGFVLGWMMTADRDRKHLHYIHRVGQTASKASSRVALVTLGRAVLDGADAKIQSPCELSQASLGCRCTH